jgi:replicative DNA helicase
VSYQPATDALILRGFIEDRHLITLALNNGYATELLPTPQARRLSKAILDLYASHPSVVNQDTVRTQLDQQGQLNAESARYLQSVLTMAPPDAADLIEGITLLREHANRDRLRTVHGKLTTFLGGAPQRNRDIVDFATDLIHSLHDLQKTVPHSGLRSVTDVVAKLEDEAIRRESGGGGLLGYSLAPFDRLTTALSGLRRGFYYGLAGAPRRGKTNLALQIATYVAANHHVPCLYYSWEQAPRVLGARLIAKETGVDPATILGGGTPGNQSVGSIVRAARERMERYSPYMFLIEAGRRETLGRIRAHAYNVMQEFQTSEIAIFFDYLQKIPLDERIADWKARTDMISTALAELSLELNIPVFAISPLDKEGCRLDERPAEADAEYSPYARPTMHHSMGSGDLEYDLDVAMVLAKDWKATQELRQYFESRAKSGELDGEALPHVEILNLYLDKNRDAPANDSYIVQYAFFVTLNIFVELDYKMEKEYEREFHQFSKTQTYYARLRDTGLLPVAMSTTRGQSA